MLANLNFRAAAFTDCILILINFSPSHEILVPWEIMKWPESNPRNGVDPIGWTGVGAT